MKISRLYRPRRKVLFSMLSNGDAFYLDHFKYIKVTIEEEIVKDNGANKGFCLSLSSMTVYTIDQDKLVIPIASELLIEDIDENNN